MPKTRGTGLLTAWTDIDARHEAGFNQWYDTEHVPRNARMRPHLQLDEGSPAVFQRILPKL